MKKAGVSVESRAVVGAANQRAELTGEPAAAIELSDGTVVTGKTTSLLGASASVLLNALKVLGGINHEIHLLPPIIIEPIQRLKTTHLGNHNPRLHTDEVLIALSINAATNPAAELALKPVSYTHLDVYKRQGLWDSLKEADRYVRMQKCDC